MEETVDPEDKEEVLNADLPVMYTHGRTARDRIGQWLALRASDPHITNIEAAEKMGIAISHLNTLIYRARKAGWLKFDDPYSRIEYEIIPKTLDNIQMFLEERDKTVTLETAKATIYRQYLESKGVSDAPKTVLALKIESSADPEQLMKQVSGTIVGTPRKLE